MDNKIRVIVKEPNKDLEIKEIENDYKELSKICQGMIDMTPLPTDDNIDICCNDEFLFNGMEANIISPEREGLFCGPLIFMGYQEEDGSSISLTDEQIEKVKNYISKNQVRDMDVIDVYDYMKSQQKMSSMEAE